MLMGDEEAYCRVVEDFVQRRMSGNEFLPAFFRLWRSDAADYPAGTPTPVPMTTSESALYATLDSINELCESYERSLPPGCGYRVSEEQFRKEVQQNASTNPLLDAGRY